MLFVDFVERDGIKGNNSSEQDVSGAITACVNSTDKSSQDKERKWKAMSQASMLITALTKGYLCILALTW